MKQGSGIASARSGEAQEVYTVSVSRSDVDGKGTTYTVQEYEVKDGVLTLAIDQDHDIVIPLFHVAMVDIQKGDPRRPL